jgi:hypothetical protein
MLPLQPCVRYLGGFPAVWKYITVFVYSTLPYENASFINTGPCLPCSCYLPSTEKSIQHELGTSYTFFKWLNEWPLSQGPLHPTYLSYFLARICVSLFGTSSFSKDQVQEVRRVWWRVINVLMGCIWGGFGFFSLLGEETSKGQDWLP